MMLYAMIMFAVTALFGLLAAWIYKGRTDLIHDYHQTKVQDKAAYGKAFGKAMAVISVAMLLSAVVALFTMWCAMAILFAGLVVGIAAIVRVQKKHNGGVF